MIWEQEKEAVRQFFGARLKKYREDAELSVVEVAAKVGVGRQYVHLVESGKANFTIESYIDMLRACNVPFSEAMAGLRTSDIPADHQSYHENLSTILNSGVKELVDGIRVNLEALSEKAVRLQKARASPNVASGTLGAPPRGKKKKS